ncbi:MAG TPA: hypothetical protein VKB23_10445 [Solirubrobacterales bacterium]|nr:hypothetical protein [Solirubrobacterales bacterium]
MNTTKTLGVAGILAVALTVLLGVVSASAAEFRASSYPETLTGEAITSPTIEMKATSGTIKCSAASPSGSISKASSTISVTPGYSGCKAFGTTASVATNSCSYSLNSLNEKHPYTGSIDVACSKAGDAIVITPTGLSCKVRIPAQAGLSGVEYKNGQTFTEVFMNLTGVKYIEEGAGCSAAGEHTASSFTDNFLVVGVKLTSLVAPGFQAESYPVLVGGSGTTTISVNSGIFNCSAAPNGTLSAGAASMNASLGISSCAAWGIKFGVNDNDCYFTLNAATSAYPYAAGSLGVGCAKAGSAISFTIPGFTCEVRIPEQSGVSSLQFANKGSGTTRSLDLTLAVSGLQYTETGNGCSSPGSHSDLKLSGGTSLIGYKSVGGFKGAQQGFWVE